jgi:hypothetical protein
MFKKSMNLTFPKVSWQSAVPTTNLAAGQITGYSHAKKEVFAMILLCERALPIRSFMVGILRLCALILLA